MTHWKHDVHSVSRAPTSKMWRLLRPGVAGGLHWLSPPFAEAKTTERTQDASTTHMERSTFTCLTGFTKVPVHHRCKTTSSVQRVMRSFPCMSLDDAIGHILLSAQRSNQQAIRLSIFHQSLLLFLARLRLVFAQESHQRIRLVLVHRPIELTPSSHLLVCLTFHRCGTATPTPR